jgi:hypothetical protein
VADGESGGLYYQYFQLTPAIQLAVLFSGEDISSFDIYHFSSVFTYNHGNPINVGEDDRWYGTARLSDDFLMPPFILRLIRKKTADVPPRIRTFVSRGLDEYYSKHLQEYQAIEVPQTGA